MKCIYYAFDLEDCINMIFKVKGISKCTLINMYPNKLVVEHWFCHEQPHTGNQPYADKCENNFPGQKSRS